MGAGGRGGGGGRVAAALLLGALALGPRAAAARQEARPAEGPSAEAPGEEAPPPRASSPTDGVLLPPSPPHDVLGHNHLGKRDLRVGARAATRPVHPPASVVWGGHVALALTPVATVWGASRVGGASPLQTGVQTLGAMLLGSVPARLAYVYANPTEPRWREVDVTLLGLSMLLTPPLAALGAWGSQQLLLGGNLRPGPAFLGAMGGAAVGHFLGMALSGLFERLLPEPALPGMRFAVALGLVGAGASFGQMWLGGGPRR